MTISNRRTTGEYVRKGVPYSQPRHAPLLDHNRPLVEGVHVGASRIERRETRYGGYPAGIHGNDVEGQRASPQRLREDRCRLDKN